MPNSPHLKDMNKERILEKYGSEKVKFSSYYKYTFNFRGIAADGTEIFAGVGGNSDDIYKLDVTADKEETLKDLWADFVTLTKDGRVIGSYDERW